MNIGIVELKEKNHHSMIYNWVAIANKNNWNITLFTSKKVYDNVKGEIKDLKFNLVLETEKRFFFVKKIKKYCKKNDIKTLVFLSVTSSFIPLLLISFKNLKIGITVHNVNAWFGNSKLRKWSHIIKKITRQKLFRESSFLIFNSNNMKSYATKTYLPEKPIYVLPFSLKTSQNKPKNKNNKFTTVYPGSVNTLRKNYDNFIRLALDNPEDNFIVLGSCNDDKASKDIFMKMQNVTNITMFKEYISIAKFDDVLLNSDLLFSDLVTEFNLSDFSEIYGRSKDSGVSYLMIQFGKLALLNKDFFNLEELNPFTFYFENYEVLKDKYLHLRLNREDIPNFEAKIEASCNKFNIEYYSKQLWDI